MLRVLGAFTRILTFPPQVYMAAVILCFQLDQMLQHANCPLSCFLKAHCCVWQDVRRLGPGLIDVFIPCFVFKLSLQGIIFFFFRKMSLSLESGVRTCSILSPKSTESSFANASACLLTAVMNIVLGVVIVIEAYNVRCIWQPV